MNSLIPIDDGGMSAELFNKLASSTKYFPRLQLFSSSSKAVKTQKIVAGHYGLVSAGKEEPYDLGPSVDLLIIAVRPKAMDINGERPISVFDMGSDAFQEIVKNSVTSNSGCMYGPEFLVYIPSVEKYATFFFSNPTMRREAPELNKLRGNWATCHVRFIPSKQYGGWHGPEVSPCSTPNDLPDLEEIKSQSANFISQMTEPQPEAAEAIGNGRER